MEPNRMVDQIAEVTNTRRNMNGKPLLNFLRVAIHWMDYLQNLGKMVAFATIDPENVCYMMELFKLARQENTFQSDNILDGIGYLDCLDAIHRQMQELGYVDGAEHFRSMDKPQLEALRDKLVRNQRIAQDFERKVALNNLSGTNPVKLTGSELFIREIAHAQGDNGHLRITNDNAGYHEVMPVQESSDDAN